MSGGNETEVAYQFMVKRLEADSTLAAILPGGWHDGIAPAGTPYPFGSIGMQAPGADLTNVSRRRILSNGLWLVRAFAVVGDSDANLATIAARIDADLDLASGSEGTGFVYMVTREHPYYRSPYVEEGETLREAGGLYRAYVQDPTGG